MRNAFYGFLSPKVQLKTSLNADVVREFVLAADSAIDVILLSPSITTAPTISTSSNTATPSTRA